MVLTNFECWANAGSAGSISADIEHQQLSGVGNIGVGVAASRHVDLFNPRAVQQNLGQVPQLTSPNAGVSHISSNGYYGFSNVNAVHEMNNNNNNNNSINSNNNNNNDTICNNNNNMCNHNLNVAAVRCKKRFFVNDDDLFANIAAGCNPAAAVDGEPVHGHFAAESTVAKRCRYDDDFAAQYFNDFFNMQAATAPPTQIGTMSCLMDTEDFNQQQQQQLQYELPLPPHHAEQKQQQQFQQQQQQSAPQQQVDVAMAATSLHTNYAPNDVECNLSAKNSFKGNNNIFINSNKKSMQAAASYMPENIKKLSTHFAEATATEINESLQLLKTNATLETLFAATHGGSQFHYWQCCNYNNKNSNINKNFIYNKPSKAEDENYYEEF